MFLHADSEDLSDWVDAKADPSLRWAHRSFCWFCHEAAQMLVFLMFLLKASSRENLSSGFAAR